MMPLFPVYLHVGAHRILLHSVLELAAFFTAFRYYIYRRQNVDPINDSNRTWIIVAAVFGALAGSRLIGGLENPDALMNARNKLVFFYQNKTVLGGFLGGIAGVEISKYFLKEKQSSGDLFTYPMILGLIIGRIGCFSMGVFEETYGSVSNLPWAMDLGDGLHRHPLALYEIVFLLLLWFLIIKIEKKYLLANGSRFKIFMISYIFYRLCIDFIKPHYSVVFGLSTIQLTALAGLIYYYRYIIHPVLLLEKNKLRSLPVID